MWPDALPAKDPEALCNYVRTSVLPDESAYQNYVVNVWVDGQPCVSEWGTAKMEHMRQVMFSPTGLAAGIGGYAGMCTGVVFLVKSVKIGGTLGFAAGEALSTLPGDILACTLTPVISLWGMGTAALSPPGLATMALTGPAIRNVPRALRAIRTGYAYFRYFRVSSNPATTLQRLATIAGSWSRISKYLPNPGSAPEIKFNQDILRAGFEVLKQGQTDSWKVAAEAMASTIAGGEGTYQDILNTYFQKTEKGWVLKDASKAREAVEKILRECGNQCANELSTAMENARKAAGLTRGEMLAKLRGFAKDLIAQLAGHTAGTLTYYGVMSWMGAFSWPSVDVHLPATGGSVHMQMINKGVVGRG